MTKRSIRRQKANVQQPDEKDIHNGKGSKGNVQGRSSRPVAVPRAQGATAAGATGATGGSTPGRGVARRACEVDSRPLPGTARHPTAQSAGNGVSSIHDVLAGPADETARLVAREAGSESPAGAKQAEPASAASGITESPPKPKRKRKKKKQPFPGWLRKLTLFQPAPLIRELERYAEQHPELGLHPDRYLIAWVWNIDRDERCRDPLASLIGYSAVTSRYGQVISIDKAKAILEEARSLEPQLKSHTLAKWLGIPKYLALKYSLRTISGCDTGGPEKEAEQRKQADKARKEKERRQAGRPTRAEIAAAGRARAAEIAASGRSAATWYAKRRAPARQSREQWLAAHALSRTKPWEAEGISRSAWERRRRRRRCETNASAPLFPSGKGHKAGTASLTPAARDAGQPTAPPATPSTRRRRWDIRPTENPDVVCLVPRASTRQRRQEAFRRTQSPSRSVPHTLTEE